MLLWLAAATALAQVVAWAIEWLRRGPRGIPVVRLLVVLVGAATATLVMTGNLVPLLDRSPTIRITFGVLYGADGQVWPWFQVVAALVAITVAAVAVGAWLAGAVVRRPARDELREEASSRSPGRTPPRTWRRWCARTGSVSGGRSRCVAA